jgi:hypothetical protein
MYVDIAQWNLLLSKQLHSRNDELTDFQKCLLKLIASGVEYVKTDINIMKHIDEDKIVISDYAVYIPPKYYEYKCGDTSLKSLATFYNGRYIYRGDGKKYNEYLRVPVRMSHLV